MQSILTQIQPETWLSLNTGLQKKKNALRGILKERGILKKGARNDYDKYTYFSEAQYKQLFTELFNVCGLELKFSELDYQTFEGTEKQANGRMPKLEFCLIDIDTGFYESTVITGEGIDKGDKAGYKAYTGALKYYLANTFMVATGDDPEQESPDYTMNKKKPASQKQTRKRADPWPEDFAPPADAGPLPDPWPVMNMATREQLQHISEIYRGPNLEKLLNKYGKLKLEDLTAAEADTIIQNYFNRRKTA